MTTPAAPSPAEPQEPGDRRQGDRRRNDRRRGDRRRSQPPAASQYSWFGALGADDHADAESVFDPGWVSNAEVAPDSRLLAREARRAGTAPDNALARVYRTYAAARAAVGVALVAVQTAGGLIGAHAAPLALLLCLAYAVQAVSFWILPRFRALSAPQPRGRNRRTQWVATIGVDLLAFSSLHVLEAGSSFNFAALLVLPVLMAGVLTSRLLALGTAAGVTLMLLAVAWRSTLAGGDMAPLMVQSGLAGMGLFAITLLAGELAVRLAREQLTARGSLELARQQAQLNRLVIEEMADGVLVVDRRLRVRAANPAARALLVDVGLSPPAPFSLQDKPAWESMARAVERALVEGHWPEAGTDIVLGFDPGHKRTLRTRVRFMQRRAGDESAEAQQLAERFCVLLLEDVRTAEARLRQEKLAAMGRVSAGIAHEIRNPLAAIAQANALLLEDELPAPQQRLARIVAENAARLKRIVDDVMEVAPGAAPSTGAVDATAEIGAATVDWAQTVGLPLGPDSRLRVELPNRPVGVVFDPDHLRRVLVNLLDNARRHATEAPAAIVLRLAPRDERSVALSVLSDGPAIAPEVERYLFEPFFSTRSRGSGLGLYICRELCERYGAGIDFRLRPVSDRWRNEFQVLMTRAAANPAASTLHLDPRE